MEVKKGYKWTEVGVLPEDWEVKELGFISDVKTGPFGSALHQKDYVDDGTPIITVEHLGEQGIVHDNLPMVSDADKKRLSSYSLNSGDIVFSRVGSVDRNSLVKKIENGWLFSGRLLRIRLNEGEVHPPYLSYYFHHESTKQRIRSVAVGQTMASLNTQILKGVKVAFPPSLPEQTAIAAALSNTDALINSLEKIIEKKRLIKQGAMQELLRANPDSNREGWEVKRLGEIGDCIIGLTYSPDNVKESGKLVMRSSNIQEGALSFEDNVYVDVSVPDKLILQKNDILICVRNGSRELIGKCALIDGQAIGETFGAFMSVYRSPYNEFIINVFQSNIIKRQIDEYLGATINQITNKSLNSFEIPFPSPDEQARISGILLDMDAEIETLAQTLSKYRHLKQGMMGELLTGKTRLVS